MSIDQTIKINQLCPVNYGSHIGDYLRYKLDQLGIRQAWLARKISETDKEMSKSNLNRILHEKAELLPSEMEMISKHLPDGFFDEFYTKNPKLKPYQPITEKSTPDASERSESYQVKGSGYRLTLEIDPVDFHPEMVDPLSASLKKALEEFHSHLKDDKKRTK